MNNAALAPTTIPKSSVGSRASKTDSCAWAARIAEQWRASVEAILEVGRLLCEAKSQLPYGQFGAMIDNDLPFNARTAQRLMAIASDQRLSNPTHVSLLPPSWGTLYELTHLSDEEFDLAIAQNIIRPDMERREIAERIRGEKQEFQPASLEKALPNGHRAIMGSRQEPDDSLDYFPTPPWATRALIERVFHDAGLPGFNFNSGYEPACGEGHIAEVLKEYVSDVGSSDVFDYGYGDVIDFLGDDAKGLAGQYDWIITNPPFGAKGEAFVVRALELARVGAAMFFRVQWLDTIGRYERIFRDRPPTLISFFAERVPLHKGRWEPEGDTATAYMWQVWVKGAKPQAPFWIAPGCRDALSRADDAERFTASPVLKIERSSARAAE